MFSALLDFYYAAWANLSAFSLLERAAVLVFIALFLLWLARWFVVSRLFFLVRHLLDWIVKGLCVLGVVILSPFKLFAPHLYLRLCNGLLETLGNYSNALLQKSQKAKFRLGWLTLIYILSLLLIGLPDITKSFVSEQYQPQLSIFQTLYRKLESPALKVSSSYEPLFPDLLPKVWLSLSEDGRRYGVIIRQYPTRESDSIRSISDSDDSVRYLWKRDGEWLYVAYDQVKGWVHESLLEKPPERAMPLS